LGRILKDSAFFLKKESLAKKTSMQAAEGRLQRPALKKE
jgi:hypothetical protein